MSQEYLDFELPIAELEAKIEALRSASDDKIDLHDEIKRLQKKSDELTKKTFANLDAWQVSRMARHPNRPYTLDYIEHIFRTYIRFCYMIPHPVRKWKSFFEHLFCLFCKIYSKIFKICFIPVLCSKACICQITFFNIPLFQSTIIKHLQIIFNNEWNNIIFQAFFK